MRKAQKKTLKSIFNEMIKNEMQKQKDKKINKKIVKNILMQKPYSRARLMEIFNISAYDFALARMQNKFVKIELQHQIGFYENDRPKFTSQTCYLINANIL